MSTRQWFWTTLGTALAAVTLYGVFSYTFDIFGMYRDAHGRSLPAYGLHNSKADDRSSKFLLNQYYVPENFNGLIIGSSGLANWEIRGIPGLKFYTEATPAANAYEQSILVREGMKRGHYQVALVEMFPAMTGEHRVYEGLETEKTTDAFGTINSVGSEIDMVLAKLHLQVNPYYPDGSRDLMVIHRITPELPIPLAKIDPVALQAQKEMVERLQADGTQVIYVVPPTYLAAYERHRAEMRSYMQTVLNVLPKAPVLDMEDPKHAAFDSDENNFSDDLHLSTDGALRMEKMLNAELPGLLR